MTAVTTPMTLRARAPHPDEDADVTALEVSEIGDEVRAVGQHPLQCLRETLAFGRIAGAEPVAERVDGARGCRGARKEPRERQPDLVEHLLVAARDRV